MKKKLLFLTLNTFSATGGIEKVCRAIGKALNEIVIAEDDDLFIHSIYDNNSQVDESYFPAGIFKGFGGSKIKFIASSIKKGKAADVVILSHINLLPVAYLIKKLSAKTKILLIAHGIEVWQPLTAAKSKMLKAVDMFLPVSGFTADKLNAVLSVHPSKITLLNNCLDPFLKKVDDVEKETELRKKYVFTKDDFILFTLTRLKSSEQYKGYDKVVEALGRIKDSHLSIKYLVAGKYDDEEKARLDSLIKKHDLDNRVILTGYVSDEELAAHFSIADAYIMPSSGEGFGIVFIEALFYGKPVIAGNVDGSVDAVAGGEFGLLVNPANVEEIANAILQVKQNANQLSVSADLLERKFGFNTYKNNWRKILGQKTGFVNKPINQSAIKAIAD